MCEAVDPPILTHFATLKDPRQHAKVLYPLVELLLLQGNRISKQSQELGEVGIIPAGALELAAQRAFGGFFLHDIQCHVAQHREVVWAVAQSVPVLVFIHHDIEPPVQPVFDPPVLADDLVEAFAGQCCAEQIIGGFGGGFGGGFADADHLADGAEAGPVMILLQPTDIGRDGSGTRLDAAVIGINRRLSRGGLACRVVEVGADVIMKGALVALQRQDIVAA